MGVAVVIVGMGGWKEYTLPFIQSIHEHEPSFEIVVVDNGAQYPQCPGVEMVRLSEVRPYPAAINEGLMASGADWYVVANNDVLIDKPFSHRLQDLNLNNLYGFYTHYLDEEHPYLSGWCYLLSYRILSIVGYFDEAFAPMWFEDADYCARVSKAWLGLVELDRTEWGIRHLAQKRAPERRQYAEENNAAYLRNLAYLRRKHGI